MSREGPHGGPRGLPETPGTPRPGSRTTHDLRGPIERPSLSERHQGLPHTFGQALEPAGPLPGSGTPNSVWLAHAFCQALEPAELFATPISGQT